MRKPAAFIDRDGTLIEEVNFLSRVEDLRLFPYTKGAISILKNAGYHVIVVTNQSGIGREKYSENDMNEIHMAIQRELDGAIDAFYFCPHLPDAGCTCRKPRLGMIDAARDDFDIDMTRSFIIGDKKLDIETGFNAQIKTAIVKTGYGEKHAKELARQPDILAANLIDAVNGLLELV